MTLIQISLTIVSIIFWLLAAGFNFAVVSRSRLSDFELNRRIKEGDKSAVRTQRRQKLLPRLLALKSILTVVALAIAIVCTIYLVGPLYGTLLSLVLVVVSPIFSRFSWLHSLIQKMWNNYEPKLIKAAASLTILQLLAIKTDISTRKISSKEELSQVIAGSQSIIDSKQIERLQSVLGFSSLTVGDVMHAIDKVKTINENETLGPLVLDELHRSGGREFPVTKKDSEEIIGVLSIDSDIGLDAAKSSVREAMDKVVYFIDEERDLESALNGFLQTGRHLFIVVGEQDKTVGVLNLNDVMAALLGKGTIINAKQLRLTERKTR